MRYRHGGDFCNLHSHESEALSSQKRLEDAWQKPETAGFLVDFDLPCPFSGLSAKVPWGRELHCGDDLRTGEGRH